MANTKISALTAGTPALTTDVLPIDRSGANFSLTAQDISNLTSFTGDGSIITNSASKGAITATIAGTSGGVPYFSSASAWASSALLASNSPVLGGGAGSAPKTASFLTTDGTTQLNIGPADTTNNGILGLKGKTSGTATLTAPAVAGTSTNAIVSSNIFSAPVGAAATPSYSFTGFLNTGLYFTGSNNSPAISVAGTAAMAWYSTGAALGSTQVLYFSNGAATATVDTGFSRDAAGVVDVGTSAAQSVAGTILANGGHGVRLVSTASITGPVPVKADTSNANQVVVTGTGDTGAGIPIGVCINSPGAAGNAYVITSGIVAMTLGTGTASIGQFVIVDTTTAGRVKCTSSYTAGTVIGVAMQAQASVGNTFNVMVGLR